jgi:SAM-dependent methyltransferase
MSDTQCNSACIVDGAPGRSKDIHRTYGNSASNLVECPTCGHCKFAEPALDEDLKNYYDKEMGRKDIATDYNDANQDAVAYVFNRIQKLTGLSDMVVHDDGCGSGYIVHYLNKQGITATGTDISKSSIEAGKAIGNTKIENTTARKFLTQHAITPDLIYLQHVIEHFHDPIAYMKDLRRLLAPKGWLAIYVPNRNYLPVLLEGFAKDNTFVYPMHLNYFTPSSLRCALHSAGFRVAHMETTANFGFWPTMRAEVLETFAKAYPDYTDPDEDKRIQKVKDEMKLFEIFCLAQRLY